MQTVLDKRLPVPLYHQLKAVILNAIQSGHWKPDDQLPTESELAQTYGVSKITVREALRELSHMRYVRREQGRGTFVASAHLEQGPRELTSFTEEMRRRGYRSSSRVLASDVVPAEGAVAEKLELNEGEQVFRLRRLRLANGQPMGVQTAYLPVSLVPGLPKRTLGSRSLYEILRTDYKLVPARARERHTAIVAGAETAALLGIHKGSPAMAGERVTFLASGHPLELVESVMRGDQYEIVLDLVNTGPEGFRS